MNNNNNIIKIIIIITKLKIIGIQASLKYTLTSIYNFFASEIQ